MDFFELIFKYPLERFSEGRLVLLTRLPGEVLLLGLLVLMVLSWWLYRQVRQKVPAGTRRLLVVLRCGLLAVLLFLLARPGLRSERWPDQKTFTAVLVDTSRSMSIEDVEAGGQARSRFAAARDLLAGGEGLIERISKHSKPLVYGFSQGAARAGPLDQLKPDGVYTNLFRSVRDVESELRGLPLAAAVMVTDAARNAGGSCEDAARLLADRGVPLLAVGLGDPNPPRDFEVLRVFAPKRIWRNTEVDAYVALRHTDFHEPFEVRICRGESVLMTRRVEPDGRSDLRRLRLTFTPDHGEGAATYRVVIPPADDEKVTDNNAKDFVLEIEDERLPVLYIEGSPRMEYRFLRRAMFRDRDFRLVGLLRLASGRFYIQGANPSEMYLTKGFPATREQLFAFKAVVLGDVEAGCFTRGQLAMLEEFVKDRGGGLLMLGGVNSFGLGSYAGTPVGRMLPVRVTGADGPYSDQEYVAQPAPRAPGHLILRIAGTDEDSALLWRNAPPLIGITPVAGAKPGATVLLTQKPTDGGRVVLAVQNYGQGRAAAFTSGGSWYWQVSRPASDEFHERFWKQMIRWLVVGARERLAVRTDADVYARRDTVVLRATVRRKDLQPVNDAAVTATVTDPLGNTEQIPMYWTLAEPGVYQCRYRTAEEGDYHVAVRVDGWKIEPAETHFQVSVPLVEFRNAGLKREVLQAMAETTGGKYFDRDAAGQVPDEVKAAVGRLKQRSARPTDRDLWDMPVLFVLCLAILSVEWISRRRSGLA